MRGVAQALRAEVADEQPGGDGVFEREFAEGARADDEQPIRPRLPQHVRDRRDIQHRADEHALRGLAGAQGDGAVRRRRDDLPPAHPFAIFRGRIADLKAGDDVALPLASEHRGGHAHFQRVRFLDGAHGINLRRAVSQRRDH